MPNLVQDFLERATERGSSRVGIIVLSTSPCRGETSMTGSTRIRSAARGTLVATAMAMGVTMGAGTAQAVDIRAVTDQYLFSYSLSQFENTRNQRPYANQLDWSSDACSWSPDKPVGFDF